MQPSRTFRTIAPLVRAAAACLAALAAPAFAASFVILHGLSSSEGSFPQSRLTLDAQGDLYGTATYEGAGGWGSLFRITPSGEFSILHDFDLVTGGLPTGSLLFDAEGGLWGTTQLASAPFDEGAVYRLDPSGHIEVGGLGQGKSPWAGLTEGGDGMLYGTTLDGGAHGVGTVFRFDPAVFDGVTIHSFDGAHDGDGPRSTLLLSDGVLVGTAVQGGHGDRGTVFRLSLDGRDFDVQRTGKGAWLFGGLTLDAQGRAWGVMAADKATGHNSAVGTGGIFMIDADGNVTVGHRFAADTSEGWSGSGDLLLAKDGWLYGTTLGGGAHGNGTIYRFNPNDHTFEVLYNFDSAGAGHAFHSRAGLVQDASGAFYGTTSEGGPFGGGTVFRFDL